MSSKRAIRSFKYTYVKGERYELIQIYISAEHRASMQSNMTNRLHLL